MPSETLLQPQDGDLAYAWNVNNLYDLIKGRTGYPVKLTKHSDAVEPTLQLANLTTGGPVLEILGHDGVTRVMLISENGMSAMPISGYMDWRYQSVAPAAPGAGTQTIRMYARAGQLYFKVEGSAEQQIPIGTPPGPSARYAWYVG